MLRRVDPDPVRPRTRAQALGADAEALVAQRLTDAGWTILARNVHVGRYELDLVAVDPGPPPALVVVEVRWRAGRTFGLPEETVDHRKKARVRAAAFGLLDLGAFPGGEPVPRLPLRFDLIVVEPPSDDDDPTPRWRHHRSAL
jgi:putative endonuclease